MKKLNLQLGSIKEMLTKEQMKKVTGGYGGDTGFECTDGKLPCICACTLTGNNYHCLETGQPCHTAGGPCAGAPMC